MCDSNLLKRFLQSTIETGDTVILQLIDSETPDLTLTKLTEAGPTYIAGEISDAPYTSVLVGLSDILVMTVDSTAPAHA